MLKTKLTQCRQQRQEVAYCEYIVSSCASQNERRSCHKHYTHTCKSINRSIRCHATIHWHVIAAVDSSTQPSIPCGIMIWVCLLTAELSGYDAGLWLADFPCAQPMVDRCSR